MQKRVLFGFKKTKRKRNKKELEKEWKKGERSYSKLLEKRRKK